MIKNGINTETEKQNLMLNLVVVSEQYYFELMNTSSTVHQDNNLLKVFFSDSRSLHLFLFVFSFVDETHQSTAEIIP